MNNEHIAAALAAEHTHDLRVAADHDRLAALASYCKPATWLAAARRARAWIDAGQLGPAYDARCCS